MTSLPAGSDDPTAAWSPRSRHLRPIDDLAFLIELRTTTHGLHLRHTAQSPATAFPRSDTRRFGMRAPQLKP